PGEGGLGAFAQNTLSCMRALPAELLMLGPAPRDWPFAAVDGGHVELVSRPPLIPEWRRRYSALRYLHGRLMFLQDRLNGRWLAREVPRRKPDLFYGFSQISLEVLQALRSGGCRSIVDHPTGDPRHFRSVNMQEARKHGAPNLWHPTEPMIDRVRLELTSADVVRVASEWTKAGLVRFGVPEDRIRVIPPFVDTARFRPRGDERGGNGPLRICF